VPQIFVRGGRKVLSGRLIVAVVSGGAVLRALFGFLTLFLAFAVRSHQIPTKIFGFSLAGAGALGVVAAGLGLGAFLGNAVGARLRIRRPVLLQAGATVLTAAAGLYATIAFSLFSVALFCLVAAASAGLAKLAVDATVQERVREQVRASAFAHSETTLMIAWVFGGAFGLIPFGGRLGVGIATGVMALAAARAVLRVGTLRKERLRGAAQPDQQAAADEPEDAATARRPRWTRLRSNRAEAARTKVLAAEQAGPATQAQTTQVIHRDEPDEQPTYHLYRPSGTPPAEDDE
jgi:hypothetical protein